MRTEDGYLIYQCLNGDSTAFGFIVDKYKKSVYASAFSRVNNFHDAQDITQEVFIKAYRNLRTLKRWDSFAGWLYRITANMCKDWSKSKSRQPDYEFVEDQELDLIDHVSMDYYHEDAIYKSIREALESLPEIYREVLTLRYFGGMSIKEISSYIGASTSTIDRRLREALSLLKEEIPAMINTAYHQKELPANFTFRIVEVIKKIRIHPISQMKGLPYGISLATGLLIAILSINPALTSFNHVGTPVFSPLPAESKVLKVGEIPVDVVKTSNISVISNLMGKGKGGEPKQPDVQNAFFMAPQGEGGIWLNKADMPTARMGLSACAMNGKIFAFGGLIGFDNRTPTLEEYDSSMDKWITRDNMPTERAFSAIATVDEKIYIIGGEIKSAIVPTLSEYDPTANTWTQKANMPTTREWLCACTMNGKIYAMGGSIAMQEAGAWIMKSIPTVEEYDPVTDKWTSKADMPTPRQAFASAVVNEKIYVFGGFEDKFVPSGKLASKVDEYDPKTDTWTTKASELPTLRVGLSASVLNGKIYVIGGSAPPGTIFSVVEEYDPVSDTWAKMQDMLTKRWMLSTSVLDDKIYAIGGSLEPPPWRADTIVPAVEEYTPEYLSNAVSSKGKLPSTWGQLKAK